MNQPPLLWLIYSRRWAIQAIAAETVAQHNQAGLVPGIHPILNRPLELFRKGVQTVIEKNVLNCEVTIDNPFKHFAGQKYDRYLCHISFAFAISVVDDRP
jgi:hypothetical protein